MATDRDIAERRVNYPRAVGTRNGRYVFDVPGRGHVEFSFLQLPSRQILRELCGGDETWMRQSFPAGYIDGRPYGINVLAVAQYCAGLCIDAEQRRRQALIAQARPGPVASWAERARSFFRLHRLAGRI